MPIGGCRRHASVRVIRVPRGCATIRIKNRHYRRPLEYYTTVTLYFQGCEYYGVILRYFGDLISEQKLRTGGERSGTAGWNGSASGARMVARPGRRQAASVSNIYTARRVGLHLLGQKWAILSQTISGGQIMCDTNIP
jgi:hypothetical protein